MASPGSGRVHVHRPVSHEDQECTPRLTRLANHVERDGRHLKTRSVLRCSRASVEDGVVVWQRVCHDRGGSTAGDFGAMVAPRHRTQNALTVGLRDADSGFPGARATAESLCLAAKAAWNWTKASASATICLLSLAAWCKTAGTEQRHWPMKGSAWAAIPGRSSALRMINAWDSQVLLGGSPGPCPRTTLCNSAQRFHSMTPYIQIHRHAITEYIVRNIAGNLATEQI